MIYLQSHYGQSNAATEACKQNDLEVHYKKKKNNLLDNGRTTIYAPSSLINRSSLR